MSLLESRVVLVIGASSGIGRAAALELAREGARVVVAARREAVLAEVAREIEKRGGEALAVPTDVARPEAVEALVEAAVARFGRLDGAFNNAASTHGTSRPLVELDAADFDRAMAVDLRGAFLSVRFEIAQMLRQEPRGGAIVNTSSVNGLGGVPGASLYAAAKAGVIALTKSAALEHAQDGIRVNALVPGAFDTPMLRGAMADVAGGDPAALLEVEKRYLSYIPQRRIGEPVEAARAAAWLLSDAASYVTGHALVVDGGMSAPMR